MAWSDPLSHPIAIRGGQVLRTLRDGADLIIARYPTRRGGRLPHVIERLMAAAERGEDVDIATDVLHGFLSEERLAIDPPRAPRADGDIPRRIAAMLSPTGRAPRRRP